MVATPTQAPLWTLTPLMRNTGQTLATHPFPLLESSRILDPVSQGYNGGKVTVLVDPPIFFFKNCLHFQHLLVQECTQYTFNHGSGKTSDKET